MLSTNQKNNKKKKKKKKKKLIKSFLYFTNNINSKIFSINLKTLYFYENDRI